MPMKTSWKTVLRLGSEGACFPHVRVDAHGWCLRLGPVPRDDDKFYSRLETLLEGLVEHGVRRRLARREVARDLKGFMSEVRDALAVARDLAATAAREAVHESYPSPPDAPPPLRRLPRTTPPGLVRPGAFMAYSSHPA